MKKPIYHNIYIKIILTIITILQISYFKILYFDYIKNIVNEHNKNIKLDFIEDIYDNKNILKEAIDWKEKQGFSITNDFNGLQKCWR